MKHLKIIAFQIFVISYFIVVSSWSTEKLGLKEKRLSTWVMDIYAQNNTNIDVDYVRFESSIETKTESNLSANGGNGNGGNTLEWVVSEGFDLSVKMPAFPGTGSIKVYSATTSGYVLIACKNFTNSSLATVYQFWEDFSGYYYSGVLVFIETSSCP